MPSATPLAPLTAIGVRVQDSDVIWAKYEAQRLFRLLGKWQKVAVALAPYLSLTKGAWWYVAHGRYITPAKINALLAHAGLPLLPAPVEVPPCPTCGAVHTAGDCHGASVSAVVVLSPGERIVKRETRKRKDYVRPCLSRDLDTRIEQLERRLALEKAAQLRRMVAELERSV